MNCKQKSNSPVPSGHMFSHLRTIWTKKICERISSDTYSTLAQFVTCSLVVPWRILRVTIAWCSSNLASAMRVLNCPGTSGRNTASSFRSGLSKSQKIMTDPKLTTVGTVEAAKSAANSVAKQLSEVHLVITDSPPSSAGAKQVRSCSTAGWTTAASIDAMLKHAPPNRAWYDVPFARLLRFGPTPHPAQGKGKPGTATQRESLKQKDWGAMLPMGNVLAMFIPAMVWCMVIQAESRKLTQSTWETPDESFPYLLWAFTVLPFTVRSRSMKTCYQHLSTLDMSRLVTTHIVPTA